MNINIKYPTHLQEIPLSAYQKWLKVEETTNDEEILAYKFVQIFTGVDLKTINKMSLNDINFLILEIKTVLEQKPKFHKRWKFNGVEFGFIPNLEKISFGEYIDAEAGLKKIDKFHEALAVLFRPIKKTYKDTYEIEEYEGNDKYHELMKNCPLNIAMGTTFFFYNLEKTLLRSMLSYLSKETTKMSETNTASGRNSPNNGIGTIQFLKSQMEKLKTSTPLQSYPYIKPLHTLHILYKKNESKTMSENDKLKTQKNNL